MISVGFGEIEGVFSPHFTLRLRQVLQPLLRPPTPTIAYRSGSRSEQTGGRGRDKERVRVDDADADFHGGAWGRGPIKVGQP